MQDQKGEHTCGYCGQRFHKDHHHWGPVIHEKVAMTYWNENIIAVLQ